MFILRALDSLSLSRNNHFLQACKRLSPEDRAPAL